MRKALQIVLAAILVLGLGFEGLRVFAQYSIRQSTQQMHFSKADVDSLIAFVCAASKETNHPALCEEPRNQNLGTKKTTDVRSHNSQSPSR